MSTEHDAALEAARRIVEADDQHEKAGRLHKAYAWDAYAAEAIVCASMVARALLATEEARSPQAGYDQLGESHFCLDCRKHWYGDTLQCADEICPFKP